MRYPIQIPRLALVASILGCTLSSVSAAGDDRLGHYRSQTARHQYDFHRLHPPRHRHHPGLIDIPIQVNKTEAPEALVGDEEDGISTVLEARTPSTGRRVGGAESVMTLAAREDISSAVEIPSTAATSTATEVEEVVVYVDENAQMPSTEKNIIPIILQATASSPNSSSSSLIRAQTTLKSKTKRTNLSSYLSYNKKVNKKLIKPTKPTKPMNNTPPSTNNTSSLSNTNINTTTHIHPGFIPQRLPGVTYAPYDLTGCRSPTNIASDFRKIAKTGLYSAVRIYGVDCSQVLNTLRAVSSASASAPPGIPPLKLFLGIFHLSDLTGQITTLVKDVQTFAATSSSPKKMSVQQVWDTLIDTISVGNELVNNGQATPAQVLAAVRTARQALRREGYNGPVVTVDTFVAVLQHPQLCSSPDTDYCAVNVHPFFDPHTTAKQAADFVKRQVLNIREAATTSTDIKGETKQKQKRVVVTETGWPTQGNANYKAVPGRAEQKEVVRGVMEIWKEAKARGFGDDGDFEVYMFTAFDDPWKKAERGTFYAEQFWGIHTGGDDR
ncbi:glycoside hydrolase superfamily [Sordaria sp. MPI-SDFR-AT-0083]|nr:glycoside hydrolase superfamily [Sordaria sp. MPI-SDFR-AT-0083]